MAEKTPTTQPHPLTQEMSLDQIKENPKNPRFIRTEKFKQLVTSIKEFPEMLWLRPLVVNKNFIVLGGNQRLKACKEAGLKTVPVLHAESLTKKQQDEFIIKDNVSFGEWDLDILANEWELPTLNHYGLDVPEIEVEDEDLEPQEDNYEIPDEIETDIKDGDLIQIGNHRLICGDAAKETTYIKLFGKDRADLVITDPPYNVDYVGKTKDALKIQNDKMSDSAFYTFLFDCFSQQIKYTKEGGAWYIFHADSEGRNFRAAFEDSGMMLKQCLIWVKNAMVMGRQDYHWRHEPCLYGWKPGAAHYFTDERFHTTVTEDELNIKQMSKKEMEELLTKIFDDSRTTTQHVDKPSRNGEHPTMKPILILTPKIKQSSRPGEIVSDTFGGAGSTMVACEQLKRICYMAELDPKYCQVIVDRMIRLTPDISVTINGKHYN